MMKFNKEMQEQGVRLFAIIIAVVSVLGVLVLAGFEAYVRWTVNKDFSFLGADTFAALALASFGLLIALLFVTRRKE